MDKRQEPTERHKELSEMFLEMGKALHKEATENKDYVITNMGNILITLSSNVLNIDEIRLMGEISAMISARRVVRKLSGGHYDTPKSETFEQIMRRLKDIDDKDNDDILDSE